jgi:frataxin-like iron-binding protein CyaY
MISSLIDLTGDFEHYETNSSLAEAIQRANLTITVNKVGNYVRQRYSKKVWASRVRGKVGGQRVIRGIRLNAEFRGRSGLR